MIHGIYLSTAGAVVEEAKQDVIAHNLANVDTTGYKSGQAIFRRRLAEAEEDLQLERPRHPVLDRAGGGVFLDEVAYARSDGPLEPSASAFDFALQGDGFFTVAPVEGGEALYTRAGSFCRGADGTLMCADGRMRVLDPRGRPIALQGASILVDASGAISVDGQPAGRLGIAGGLEAGRFERIGANLYRHVRADGSAAGPAPPATRAVVRQHFLERSDVKPVIEMVRLIQSQRAYESNLQMLRIQDGTLGQAVQKLALVAG